MLDHMFDYGFPIVHNKYALQCMIRPEGALDKIEKTIIGRSQKNKSDIEPLKKYVENLSDMKPHTKWRIPNMKVTNEVLFDVVEYLDYVMDEQTIQFNLIFSSKGNVIQQEINGDVKVEGNLSGVPNIVLYLNIPIEFDDYSVHECLYGRTDSLENEKVLNFIVPSGNFTLLSYKQFTLQFIYHYQHSEYLAKIPIFCLCQQRFQWGLFPLQKITYQKNMTMTVRFENQPVRGKMYEIKDFHVKFIYSEDVKIKSSTQTYGIYTQNNETHKALWRLGKLNPKGKTIIILNYEAATKEEMHEASTVICVKFCVPTLSFSGTKIEKAVFKNKGYNVTKKARCVAKSGYFEIRA